MTECTKRTYKFDKGEPLGVSFNKSGSIYKTYELSIISDEGKIGTVHPEYIRYQEHIDRGKVFGQYLTGGSNPSYSYRDPNNLSIELKEDGYFAITRVGKYGFISPIIGRDHMLSLTEHGEKVFSECCGSTLEYYAPTDDSTDHSFDQASCDTDNKPYLATNLDIL